MQKNPGGGTPLPGRSSDAAKGDRVKCISDPMQLLRQIRGDSWIEKKSGSKLPVCVEEQRWKCPVWPDCSLYQGSHCFVLFGSLFFPSTDQHLVESDLNLGQLVTALILL